MQLSKEKKEKEKTILMFIKNGKKFMIHLPGEVGTIMTADNCNIPPNFSQIADMVIRSNTLDDNSCMKNDRLAQIIVDLTLSAFIWGLPKVELVNYERLVSDK